MKQQATFLSSFCHSLIHSTSSHPSPFTCLAFTALTRLCTVRSSTTLRIHPSHCCFLDHSPLLGNTSFAALALYISCTAVNMAAPPVDSTTPRNNTISPLSILHFIRSTPSPNPNPPASCPTCHVTPLPAYSLYSHGLSSVSPPAVLLHHLLPSPPPLLSHTSLAPQHLQSANSAHNQLIDTQFMFTASNVSTPTHVSHVRPTLATTPASTASQFHNQPTFQPYSYPLPATTLPYHPQTAVCSSPPAHPYPATTFQSAAPLPLRIDREAYHRYRRRLTDEEEQLAYFKTEVCRTHLTTGQCLFGADCQFAHSFDELRPREFDSKYKTELCKRYHTLGVSGCKFGVRCKFMHDEVRIKAGDGEYWLCSESEGIIRVEVVPTHHYHRRQLLDQLTFFPPTGPVSPLSTSPIPPRRPRRTLSPPAFTSEYASSMAAVPSLASLPSFLAAAVSPAQSTRSVPVSWLDSGESTSTDPSSGGGSSHVSGVSYSMPARYRRLGEGEFVLGGDN